MIELASDHLRVVVDPEHGAQIERVSAPDGPNLLFHGDWLAPVPADRSLSYGSAVNDWLSAYRGGWQELFPNAGADCVVDGVPLPFHGEASTARWEVVAASPTELRVRTGARLPVVLDRRMRLSPDGPALLIDEVVTNESDLPVSCIWGHHPAFAAPPGTVLDIPATSVRCDEGFDTPLVDVAPGGSGRWPSVPGKSGDEVDLSVVPAGPVERLAFLPDVREGWAALRRPDGLGAALAWDRGTFGHCWLWQEYGGEDFPWYGRAAITAIEPHAAWPGDGLAAARAAGRALLLAPRGCRETWITMALFDATPDRPVTGVARSGDVTTRRTP